MKGSVTTKPAPELGHTNAYHVVCEVPYRGTTTHTAWTAPDGRGLWIDGKQAVSETAFDATRDPRKEIRLYFKRHWMPPVY